MASGSLSLSICSALAHLVLVAAYVSTEPTLHGPQYDRAYGKIGIIQRLSGSRSQQISLIFV